MFTHGVSPVISENTLSLVQGICEDSRAAVNTNSSSGSPVYTLPVGGPVNTLNCNTTNATCIDLCERAAVVDR